MLQINLQVSSQGSLDVLSCDITNAEPIQLVSTMPVDLNNHVTNISQLGNVLTLEQASITNIDTTAFKNLPQLLSLFPCGQMVDNITEVPSVPTNANQVYVLAMTIDSDTCSEGPKKQDEELSQLQEPQPASTLKMPEAETAAPNLNETILAGNLQDKKKSLEGYLPTEENGGFDNMKITGEDEDHAKKRETMTSTPLVTTECRKIKLQKNTHVTTSSLLPDDKKQHNRTFCKNWVANVASSFETLAQVDTPAVENTSLNLSNLNITYISHNKPEYSASQQKFIGQRSHPNRNSTLLTKKSIEFPTWYISCSRFISFY